MNINLLIKMTNEIGEFFAGTAAPEAAAAAVANHLRRYWDPRMRAQMLAYYEQRQGAGLSELGRQAVALLHADPNSASVSPASAAPPKAAGA
jgi:formate dehydrogenase subunit delta